MILALAWRNIWRNRRRTLITVASVVFAAFFALLLRSMQLGSYEQIVRTSVSSYTGYIQVHGDGYWESRSFERSFPWTNGLKDSVAKSENVTLVVPRVESFVLAAQGDATKGAMLVGVDPVLEERMTGIRSRVIEGRYFQSADEKGLLMAEGLAKVLKARVGARVALIGQGYQELSAAAIYTVVGIVRYVSPQANDQMLLLPLREAQWFFSAQDRITSASVMITGQEYLASVASVLKRAIGDKYEVMTWEEMMPEVVQSIQVDSAGGVLMLSILYLVIGFGILGTVMTTIVERRREFGTLVAVGMQKERMVLTVGLETVMMAATGVAVGVLVSLPVLAVLHANPLHLTGEAAEGMIRMGFEPIFPFSLDPSMFVSQALAVLVTALVVALYPMWTVTRIDPAVAIRRQ